MPESDMLLNVIRRIQTYPHNDYPMAPEHLTVTRDMLSYYAVSLLDPDRPWTPGK